MHGGHRNKAVVGLLAGTAVLVALFLWRGIDTVAALLAQAGLGLALVCLFAPPEQWLAAEAWRALFPRGTRPGATRALVASWIGSAVNSLLPVATIGGEIAKARLAILWKAPAAETLAATTVDKTVQAIAILLWGLAGAGFLALFVGRSAIVTGLLIGAGLLFLGIAGFIVVQIRGGFSSLAAKVGGRSAGAVKDAAETMERVLRAIYRDPARLAGSTALRLAQRVVLAGEVVLVGWLMDAPVGLVEAVILKGIIGAIRGVSFAVPAGLGVQEGGYVAIGALLGYPPDLMIAVSLATRVREILPSLPFLVLWQSIEGRALWSKRRAKRAAAAEPPFRY